MAKVSQSVHNDWVHVHSLFILGALHVKNYTMCGYWLVTTQRLHGYTHSISFLLAQLFFMEERKDGILFIS